MDIQDIYKLFPIHLPIALKGVFWNGNPDEFSNIGFNLNYSQKYGMTFYAKTGVYGFYNGVERPHNGHDFAGADKSPLVLPCRAWVSSAYLDASGYGNCCFFESETIGRNGDTVKMEYVLAHMKELPEIKVGHWYEAGTPVGLMGSTGMSTGTHTHFAGRPWIRKTDGSWEYLFKYEFTMSARGYIDLEPCMIEKPIFDKQVLINVINDSSGLFTSDEKATIIGRLPDPYTFSRVGVNDSINANYNPATSDNGRANLFRNKMRVSSKFNFDTQKVHGMCTLLISMSTIC
jgi:murein DD-endopeptidase MepM/ murein hydrolase activator NlpD